MSDRYIGVDVGGTKIAVAALGDDGLDHQGVSPTAAATADELIDEICELVEGIRDGDVRAIGVGVPSVVDFATGTARASVNVPFANVPLREVFGERLGLPVFVDNDATVAALAEACEDGEIAIENLVMFTVGTGVGGGLVLGGRPYRGATGAAAEMGHIIIGLDLSGDLPEPSERFPQDGSLESLAAGTALDRLADAAADEHPDSYLGRRRATGNEITGHDAVDGAAGGDEICIGLLATLGSRLGVGIANAINTFDPDVVAIGGGVSNAGELLLEPARRAAVGYVLPGVGTKTEIRLSKHGPKTGVLGAALLAKQELKRREESSA
jgi:glucokinase